MERKSQSKTGINVYYKYRRRDHKHLPIILDAQLRALFSQKLVLQTSKNMLNCCNQGKLE